MYIYIFIDNVHLSSLLLSPPFGSITLDSEVDLVAWLLDTEQATVGPRKSTGSSGTRGSAGEISLFFWGLPEGIQENWHRKLIYCVNLRLDTFKTWGICYFAVNPHRIGLFLGF